MGNNSPRPGDRVEVRLAGGRTRVHRVARIQGKTVYITTEERFANAKRLGVEPEAVLGVPLRDISVVS
jgi:hypothetical protein